MGNNIEALLKPQSVVVIGASAQQGKVGNVILTQVARGKFRVYAVNPKGGTACGLPFYASVRDLPEVPDLAVLAMPAAPTIGAAQECIDLGVKAIVAIASGFGETGDAGRVLEKQLADMLCGSQTRLLGPNTLGLLVPESGLDTNFLPADRMRRPDSGNIVLLSQSGSVAIGEIDSNALTGVSISAFVGFGNRLDIDENELMDYYAEDAGTDVLAMYLESFADPQGFLERCRRIVPKKPVILLKAGRSEAGARAVQLHTGSLAGSDRVTDGALRQAGVIRVYDTQELMDAARILAFMPPIYNNRVAVLTNGGGFGIVASDFIESTRPGIGARLAVLSDETKQKIASAALSFAAVRNPIDLTGSLNNAMCDAALSALQEDPGVDIILFTLGFQPPAIDEGLIDIIIKWAKNGSKPMIVVPIGSDIVLKAMQKFNAARVPAFTSIWRGVQAIDTLAKRGDILRKLQAAQVDAAEPAKGMVIPSLQAGIPVAEHEVKAALREIGVNVPKSIILRPGEHVQNVPLNYPLVVKISAADILHKTEQKGVLLGIRDQTELETAVADMRSRFATGDILIEEMEERGVEMIVGLVRDSTFGLAIMCGLGGTTAELYQDVSFRKVPITRRDADEMLSELKGHKLLEGFRGIKTDREGLIDLLVKIAQFGEFYQDGILQMDLNPVIVQAHRAVAVDAKILWAQG
ncbi:MAG TPA: acetate--CoA ligase family protein [Longilinea sp.]|nr:acetate--CoA ligase family protein [Longilinea sp.]